MTVSGLPEPCIHHARSICHLALDMMEIAGQVQVDGEPVQVSNCLGLNKEPAAAIFKTQPLQAFIIDLCTSLQRCKEPWTF